MNELLVKHTMSVIGTAIHSLNTATMLHDKQCTCAPCVQAKSLTALYVLLKEDSKSVKTGDEEVCTDCGREYQRSLKGIHKMLCSARKK